MRHRELVGVCRVMVTGILAVAVLAAVYVATPGRHAQALSQAAFTVGTIAACGVIFLQVARRAQERRIWLVLGTALLCSALSNALGGWGRIAHSAMLESTSIMFGFAAVPGSLLALWLLLKARIGRLPLTAWLDGAIAALVLQAGIALMILAPLDTSLAASEPAALAALVYPLADVIIVGVIAAAAAQSGWSFKNWGLILAGMVLATIGDASLAAQTVTEPTLVSATSNLAWLAGTWVLAMAAWAPIPPVRPQPGSREWMPAACGLMGLVLLASTALTSRQALLPCAFATVALIAVIARFRLTLRQNTRMLGEARGEAMTDALTGLGNRRRLIADLDVALSDGPASADATLVLFDLNGFKHYNDVYGHQAGDGLLAAMGSKLAESVRGHGIAYRMGGDEFCVLLGALEAEALTARATAALTIEAQAYSVTSAHGSVQLPGEATSATTALRIADRRMYERKSAGRVGASRQVARTLSLALEERDPSTNGQLEEIQSTAESIARHLELDEADVERIRLAALLHDVGKIAIPEYILRKPAALDEVERRLVRRHPLTGQRIVESAPALRDVATLVRSIYERPDGLGYPDGLPADEIPLGSRIVHVAVAFHAMTSDRPYRPAMTDGEAREELRRGAGATFDATVVRVFLALPSRDGGLVAARD